MVDLYNATYLYSQSIHFYLKKQAVVDLLKQFEKMKKADLLDQLLNNYLLTRISWQNSLWIGKLQHFWGERFFRLSLQ